jgi:hypothetical protein
VISSHIHLKREEVRSLEGIVKGIGGRVKGLRIKGIGLRG